MEYGLMPVKLSFDGIKEFRQALAAMPDDMAKDAGPIVEYRARFAAGAIRANYPRVTGNLQNGVVVERKDGGRYGRAAVVRNKAPHAFIYEYGTEARHYYTSTGKRHATGRMPAGHVFGRGMAKQRKLLFDDLAALIERYGLRVVKRAA